MLASSEKAGGEEDVEANHGDVNKVHTVVNNLHSSYEKPSHRTEKETIERNLKKDTVNGVVKGGEKSVLQQLPNLGDPSEKTAYIANDIILKALGDEKSSRFYELVAAKVPEQVIREVLAEVRADGAKSPARLFTYKIKQYALDRRKREAVKGMGG